MVSSHLPSLPLLYSSAIDSYVHKGTYIQLNVFRIWHAPPLSRMKDSVCCTSGGKYFIMLHRIKKIIEIVSQFEEFSSRVYCSGLQDVVHESASRAWLRDCHTGWTGRDFVKQFSCGRGTSSAAVCRPHHQASDLAAQAVLAWNQSCTSSKSA